MPDFLLPRSWLIRAQKQNTISQRSRFDHLPEEIRIIILEQLHIIHGRVSLAAAIRASPTLFRTFRVSRTAILIAPALFELGPVIRDAVALALAREMKDLTPYAMEPLTKHNFVALFCEDMQILRQVNGEFRDDTEMAARYSTASHILMRSITPRMVVPILRLNEAAQHLIDIYEESRLWDMEDRIIIQDCETRAYNRHIYEYCAEPFSLAERQRLGRALLRRDRQLDMGLERCGEYMRVYHYLIKANSQTHGHWIRPLYFDLREQMCTKLHETIYDPYHPWELEEISQAHNFILTACYHLKPSMRRSGPGSHNITACQFIHDNIESCKVSIEKLSQMIRYSAKPWRFPDTVKQLPHKIYSTAARAIAKDDLKSGLRHDTTSSRWTLQRELKYSFPMIVPHGHSFTKIWKPPASTFRKTTLPPPYGWSDAVDGSRWDNWGACIHPSIDLSHVARTAAQVKKESLLENWKWWGLIFWDEKRVEGLKLLLDDPGFETGWLTRIGK